MYKNKNNKIMELYINAKQFVLKAGYEYEIRWQDSLDFNKFTEKDFLKECAWVILCSGFKEEYVRKSFGMFSICFCNWNCAADIIANEDLCRSTSLLVFKNKKKIESIIKIAHLVNNIGFQELKTKILKNPIEELKKLPYIGNITSYHLAKNLGYPIPKSDRHLSRIAKTNGYNNVISLCQDIAKITGEKLSVVDIILWRFSVLTLNHTITI